MSSDISHLDEDHRVEHWQHHGNGPTRPHPVERIQQTNVALRRAIEFGNLGYPEPLGERRPDLWAESVADTHADTVLCVRRPVRLSQEVATDLTNVEGNLRTEMKNLFILSLLDSQN